MSISHRLHIPPLSAWSGFGLIALGTLIGRGGLTGDLAWMHLLAGFDAATFVTAAGLCGAGVVLLVTRPMPPADLAVQPEALRAESVPATMQRGTTHLSNGVAALVLVLGMAGLTPEWWARTIGPLAPWLEDASHAAVRMPPLTALGFILAGVAALLFNRAHRDALLLAAQLVTLALLFVGLLGVIGQWLGLHELYKWHADAAAQGGIGFVIYGIGLLSIQFRDSRFQQYWRADESRRISLMGAAILVMTGLIGVLGGFYVLYPQTVNEMQNNLQLALKSRNETFRDAIEQEWLNTIAVSRQPLALDAMDALETDPADASQRAKLRKVADRLRAFGFSAVVFRDNAGRDIARSGDFLQSPELRVALRAPASDLLWAHGFFLHALINLTNNGRAVGTLEAERPLSALDAALRDTAYLGKTTDFAICAAAGNNVHCFPFRSTNWKVLRDLPAQFNGRPIPVSYALAGKSGIIHTEDYRGRQVIAAYAPLGTTGLGTVLKIDAEELYQPIAATLGRLLAVLLVLVIAGIVLLRLQVLPLVRKMAGEIVERKKIEARISYLAYHDALTDLPNRLLVRDRFDQAMAYADRCGAKTALLFIDLDNFKVINDSLGHSIGDAVLKAVTARLRDCVRKVDTISRHGGDEFLIVLTGVNDSTDITGITEKLLAQQTQPFDIDGNELTSTFSIGITVYPDDGNDFETLLKKADTAMYHAKEAGRNTYRFFTQQMNVDAIGNLRMRQGLRKALERDEFVLHYQPQIELATGKVIGAEALIRWMDPDAGMVPPVRFIPIAEDSGLIVPIGEWVLREACRQAVAWRESGLPELMVAVNLSAIQFKRGDVEKSVSLALTESGLDPALLELELTESILIQDPENVLATVQRLKSMGVRHSIDDFGTGYSSLSYLKRFAVDRLKIDQSFIRDMVDDPNDAAIVYAVIQMAKALNLKTVAEGVEDERTLTLLRMHHCDEAQGYYFARPMPADEFSRYILAGQHVRPLESS